MPTEDKLPVATESKTCSGWESTGNLCSPLTFLNWSLHERNQAMVSYESCIGSFLPNSEGFLLAYLVRLLNLGTVFDSFFIARSPSHQNTPQGDRSQLSIKAFTRTV